jgi:translocation and assembly module TamA
MLILVDPGEPVRFRNVAFELAGEAADDPEFVELMSANPMVPGAVLHHGNYENFRRQLLALGQRRGYFDATLERSVIRVQAGAGAADVDVLYNSGRRFTFGELENDEEQLSSSLLKPLLPFEPGDPFELGSLQRFQGALQRTGYFSSVVVRPDTSERGQGEVPIVLELSPARRHTVNLGVGYSDDTEERVSVTWRTPKINRWGHSQETRLQWSRINPSGRFTYNIPLSHPLNDVLQLLARVEDDEFGDLDSRQEELGVRREITEGRWIRGYSLRGLSESWDVLGDRRSNDYLLPGVTISHKRREGLLVDPSEGFSQFYRLEAGSASAGSDIDLFSVYANLVFVRRFSEQHRLVLRNELGAIYVADKDRDQLAPSLNFFAGGSNSIRGFGYQSIGNETVAPNTDGEPRRIVVGGTRLLTASIEYQYYVNENWGAAVFADGGDAFDEGEFDANYAAGFGVHYMTPVGAIKLELANSISEDNPSWRIHVNVGAEF